MALKRVLLVLVLTVAMTPQSSVTQGPSRNDRFTPFECYNDLCVTKGQYCSASEERCKYCQPGHCMDKSKTPTECLPLCPELLSNAATTTRSGESGSNEVAVTRSGEHGAHNDAVTEPASNAGLLTTQPHHLVDTTILVALAIAAVILMILVGVVILYVRAIHKRLRHADPPYRRDVSARELSHVRTSIEEGCSLLAGDSGVSLGSPASGGSSGQSCSTSSNSSP